MRPLATATAFCSKPRTYRRLFASNRQMLLLALAAMAAAQACHPECRWQCDDPVCTAECAPVCAKPVCTTVCENEVPCRAPACHVRCPNEQCEADSCPQCETVCEPPHCSAAAGHCTVLCEETSCDWKCRKPSNCARPRCELQCEAPACTTATTPSVSAANSASLSLLLSVLLLPAIDTR